LHALVSERWGTVAPGGDDPAGSLFGPGATLRRGDQGWVLLDDRPERGLGPALAWARQQGVSEMHVLAETGVGVLARRSLAFEPTPIVWQIEGRTLVPAGPAAFAPPLSPPPEAAEATALLHDAEVDVVVEHGEVFGEVLGLEVARVVVDEHGARLAVGVGRHDREAFAMLHGEEPTPAALARVVDTVRHHRRPGAPTHPLNQLATERWMRARLVEDPSLVGAAGLCAFESPVPRPNLKEPFPAAAVGHDLAGLPLVVVCSVGIDLDLVPAAADARAAWVQQSAPGSVAGPVRLVLSLPQRDAHPATRSLAGALVDAAEVVALAGDWRG
jgi:hypothetical protein